MPAHIIPYVRGVIQGFKPTTTWLAQQFGFSHDQLTRALRKRHSWRMVILWAAHRLFGSLKGGYLILDDTVLAKPYAKKLEEACFAYSSSRERVVYGYHLVLLCWTDGQLTLPLAWRWYRRNGPSKVDLACGLLKLASTVWHLQPEGVVFDSWYSSGEILNLIHSFGWRFFCQIKSNRVISHAPIKEDLTTEGDFLTGLVTGLVKGTVFRHGDKFFLTNAYHPTLAQLLTSYHYRWAIEEVFRFLKDQLHLEGCQARSKMAQETHLASCLLAYLILQREALDFPDQYPSLYAAKRIWLLQPRLGRNHFNHYVKVLNA